MNANTILLPALAGATLIATNLGTPKLLEMIPASIDSRISRAGIAAAVFAGGYMLHKRGGATVKAVGTGAQIAAAVMALAPLADMLTDRLR